MTGAQPDHRVRGGRASTGDLGNAAKLIQDTFSRDALDRIHAAIVAVSRERPLTRLELRIRCLSARRSWRDEGCSSSTYYRRKKRARLAAEAIKANPQKSDRAIAAEIGVSQPTVSEARRRAGDKDLSPEPRLGRDGKSYPSTQPTVRRARSTASCDAVGKSYPATKHQAVAA